MLHAAGSKFSSCVSGDGGANTESVTPGGSGGGALMFEA